MEREGKALGDPMSKIMFQLQSSLLKSEAQALLSGSNAFLAAEPQQANLLNRVCFGVPISTFEKASNGFNWSWKRPFTSPILSNASTYSNKTSA